MIDEVSKIPDRSLSAVSLTAQDVAGMHAAQKGDEAVSSRPLNLWFRFASIQ